MSYPDAPIARVLALVEGEGYSAAKAAELVSRELGVIVNERSARRWVERARPVSSEGNKPILDKWSRLVSQAQDLIGDGLDYIEQDESGVAASKNLQTLNIIAGTGTDKLQKEREQSQPRDLANLVIVINAAQPEPIVDYIEGEVKDA